MKYLQLFEQFLIEKKPEWQDADWPDAEGRFRDLSIKDLAAWLIKSRKEDLKAISGSLTQQIVFNRNEDPEYAEKMEKTRQEVYKQLDRQDLMEDFETDHPELDRIRKFAGSIQDLHTWMRNAMESQGRSGETNPYKDTIMVNGPQTGELDQSLPYQDFQNGKSDLVKNRHGRKDS